MILALLPLALHRRAPSFKVNARPACSRRQAAERFGVSAASAVGWQKQSSDTGEPFHPTGRAATVVRKTSTPMLPRSLGFTTRRRISTLAKIKVQFAETGIRAGIGTLWRAHAAEQELTGLDAKASGVVRRQTDLP